MDFPPLLSLRPHGADRDEEVAVEVPVALTVNGISQAVMLATPADLEDFALGFGIGEGWFMTRHELLDVEATPQADGIELALTVTAACEQRLKTRRRTLAGRTGCGLCGVESLAQLGSRRPAAIEAPPVMLERGALDHALSVLPTAQILNARCGGLHGAAWCRPDGKLVLAREDVGRHNALDKLIGALTRQDADVRGGFVLMSSRASFELVHKTAMAGAGLLACMSAPSSLAIATAGELGVQLWAFVREGRATRYA
ncbi:formate dehydrogenase accessory sulfurtransferase FdhD [Roseateles sp. BYS78W]|uniref:Sulfur carrier protein FdhD n=1 Tax=Pelomonas candidula TaxID=3299025 RepID=A0ABW7H9N6_9BURK